MSSSKTLILLKSLLLINPKDHHGLDASHLDQATHTMNPTPRELGEEDHALNVVVLEQVDIRAHVEDVIDLNHHRHVHFRVLHFVHATLQVGRVRRHGLGIVAASEFLGFSHKLFREQENQ